MLYDLRYCPTGYRILHTRHYYYLVVLIYLTQATTALAARAMAAGEVNGGMCHHATAPRQPMVLAPSMLAALRLATWLGLGLGLSLGLG